MLTDGIARIDHVAIVVRDLDLSLQFYRDTLGITPSRVIDFPSEGVKIAFLPMGGPGGSEIELLEPANPESGVARFLEKRGEGLHHICLEVHDIARALAELQAEGTPVLDATPRPTAEGRG
ncbi:MAG: VOC family protein, partial [Ktedonobacterales bacterium]